MARRVTGMPTTIVLISGGKQQAGTSQAARVLFTSPLFQTSVKYADHIQKPWYIVSAGHGLVKPEEILAPLPRGFSEFSLPERTTWVNLVSQELSQVLKPGDCVILLAGKTCCQLLEDPIRALACGLETPLVGKKIGEQLAWLKKELLV
jgi:hypothetical protein